MSAAAMADRSTRAGDAAIDGRASSRGEKAEIGIEP